MQQNVSSLKYHSFIEVSQNFVRHPLFKNKIDSMPKYEY